MDAVHEQLHLKALRLASDYRGIEAELISVLQELDRAKTYVHFEQPSLFAYATRFLKLTEHTALTLIGIARKSMQVPELKAAIENGQLNMSNARRILPILSEQNKVEWIEKASTLTQSGLDRELAMSFPKQHVARAKVDFKNEHLARIEADVPERVVRLLKRAQELLAQKKRRPVEFAVVLEEALDEFVARHAQTRGEPKRNTRADVKLLHVSKQVPFAAR